jgi:hypothetical protein
MSSSVIRFTRTVLAVFAVLLGVAALLVSPQVAVAQLDCAAVAAQIQAHNAAAAAHNANPPNPNNSAAVQAYNAEAQRGNAEGARLEGLAAQCRAQGQDVPDVGAPPSAGPQSPSPAPAPAPAVAVPAPPVPAPAVNPASPLPVRPSTVLPNTGVTPGTAYHPATAARVHLNAPAPLPGSTATNPRFAPAPAQPVQAPGLNTPAGQPGMTATQQEFFATAPRLLDAAKAVPLPSNAGGGQVYRLPDITGTGAVSNSGPALYVGPGATRAVAGPLDTFGRPTGSYGYLDAAGATVTGTGEANIAVPGATVPYQRGHLWPNRFGGPGNVLQFLAPELGATNTGAMRVYERHLGQIVTGAVPGVPAQNVTYLKIPIYIDDKVIPDYYLLIAWGEQGWNLPPTYVQNF